MKALLLLLFTVLPLLAQDIDCPVFVAETEAAGGAAASYLINQNLEGAGFDNGETWTTGGTVDADYTTTVLKGAQSLYLSGAFSFAHADFSAQSVVEAHARIRLNTPPSVQEGIFLLPDTTSGNAVRAGVYVDASRNVYLYANGGVSAASSTVLDLNTAYYTWLVFTTSGECVLAMSPTSTRPSVDGGTDVYLTRTGSAGTANRVYLYNGGDGAVIYDNILVDDAVIGNNPNP